MILFLSTESLLFCIMSLLGARGPGGMGWGTSPWARRWSGCPCCWSSTENRVRMGDGFTLWLVPSLSLSLSLLYAGLAMDVRARCLQMCTNKGGLKQNESKQTNGIRVMGVTGLVHSDKQYDALCECVSGGLSVVRCVCVCVCGVYGCFCVFA